MFLEKLEKLKKYPSDLILLIVAAIAIVILLTINILIFGPLLYSGGMYNILDFDTVPLFALILLVSRKLNEKILNIGLYMSLTPIIAGIFDIIENINLLIMLNETPAFASFVPLIASLSATIKFGFLIVGAIFFLLALILLVIKKFKK